MIATEEDLSKVNIEIFDDDVGRDSSLGTVSLKLEKNTNILERWIPLENCQSGEILVSANTQEVHEDAENLRSNTEKSSLTFTITKAKDLEKSDFIGKSDPYVVLSYKDKTVKSKTINNNQSPVWNFSLVLEVDHADPGFIEVQIFDEDYTEDDKIGSTTVNVRDLLASDHLVDQWVQLDHCKSGEVQFSSRITKKTITETRETETVTITEMTQLSDDPSVPVSTEFDKLHKKSCKMILRRVDSQGNVIEEEFDDKSTSGRKTSEVHMSSGIAMVGRPKDDEWDSVPVLETVTKTTKIITQKFDHEGNLLAENITPEKEEVLVNRSMTTGFDEEGDDIQEFLSETYNFPTITKKSVSEVKIVKMVDDLGNVTEQIFNLSEENGSSGERILDSEGNLLSGWSGEGTRVVTNVAVENIEFLSDDDCEDDQTLIKSIQELQKSTKSKISGLIQTVKEAKNTTATFTSTESSSVQVEEKKISVLASPEPSLENLSSELSVISSINESNICSSDCLVENSSSSSDVVLTPCQLSDNVPSSDPSHPHRNIQSIQGNQDIGYLLYLW